MARKLPNPPRWHGGPIPALLDCSPLRVSGLKDEGKPFDPKPGKPGSRLTWKDTVRTGETFSGIVWDAAPKGWWVHLDGAPGVLVQVLPATKFLPMREADRVSYGTTPAEVAA